MDDEGNLTETQALIVWGILILTGVIIAVGAWNAVFGCAYLVFKKYILLSLAFTITGVIILMVFCVYNALIKGDKNEKNTY